MTLEILIAQAAQTEQTITDALGVLQTIFEYAGVIAFAISGALVAGRKHMDFVGVIFLGSVVAVGGGTLRDVLVGNLPVFWIEDPTFIIVGALTALATIPLSRSGTIRVMERYNLVHVSDAAGMALFVVTGTNVALAAGANGVAAAIVGVISGVGGGIIRDLMANRIPVVLNDGKFYATAAFAGAILYVLLLRTALSPFIAAWITVAVIFAIRWFSGIYGLRAPTIEIETES